MTTPARPITLVTGGTGFLGRTSCASWRPTGRRAKRVRVLAHSAPPAWLRAWASSSPKAPSPRPTT